MNLYFIVEGKRTEYKVYPAWLSRLLPSYERVRKASDAVQNHYFLAHGDGVPSLYRYVANAVAEMNELGNFSFLIICLDAEDFQVEEVEAEVLRNMERRNARPQGFQVKIIVQNRCIETWMLGNRRVFKANPDSEQLTTLIRHYDVSRRDPELMPIHSGFGNFAAHHLEYLRLMLKERNIEYSKEFPRGVTDREYLDQLILRTQQTDHLRSLHAFLGFCNRITQ